MILTFLPVVLLGACGLAHNSASDDTDGEPDTDTRDTGDAGKDCEDWPPEIPAAPLDPDARGLPGTWWVASYTFPGTDGAPVTHTYPSQAGDGVYQMNTLTIREIGGDYWWIEQYCSYGEVYEGGYPESVTWRMADTRTFVVTFVDEDGPVWTCTIEDEAPHAMSCEVEGSQGEWRTLVRAY